VFLRPFLLAEKDPPNFLTGSRACVVHFWASPRRDFSQFFRIGQCIFLLFPLPSVYFPLDLGPPTPPPPTFFTSLLQASFFPFPPTFGGPLTFPFLRHRSGFHLQVFFPFGGRSTFFFPFLLGFHFFFFRLWRLPATFGRDARPPPLFPSDVSFLTSQKNVFLISLPYLAGGVFPLGPSSCSLSKFHPPCPPPW